MVSRIRSTGSDVDNTVNFRGIYPTAPGQSLGQRGGAATPYVSGGYNRDNPGQNASSALASDGTGGMVGTGVFGQPLAWWGILVALLIGLMWAAQKYGSEGAQFHSVKLSIYNVLVISLAAMIGLGFFKMLFGKFRIPGLSAFVAAV